MENNSLPLHLCRVDKSSAIINRAYILLHSAALTALIFYRASSLFRIKTTHLLPWLLVFSSELILSFIWFLGIGYRWRPVKRTVFPERLPEDEALPAIDVLICTADPSKEPPVKVMNTVISAMALDYPPEKIYVYVSDDGGSPVTLLGMKEAWKFAALWIPFCRRHEIKTTCPEAYFSESCSGHSSIAAEFTSDEKKVKEKYEIFKDRVMSITENGSTGVNRDHPSVIEVINNKYIGEASAEKDDRMPLLVYVSREKRPSHPHHFKAGALNVLLRVSAMISNSPFLLVLDCDMYCNDPTSVRQAMCFHLDPKISPSLAFVQFPQRFHNLNKADIYDSNLTNLFKRMWLGMDGANGPCLSGTCFYLKREPLLGDQIKSGVDIMELKESFGPSNEFMKSLGKHYKPNLRAFSSEMLKKEIHFLASCAYEEQTKWGKEVGLLYFSVAEDYLTSLVSLHGKGWTSVYHYPERPAFLGAGTTNLNDVLVQGTRWTAGLVEVALSRFCPLIYAPNKLSTLHTMCYSELAFFPFYFLPVWCFATIPQLCLLNGISLYPEVSTKFFLVFSFIFLSSNAKLIQEILSTGGSVLSWRNVQLMWMIKSVTCHMYGSLDAIKETIGLREASFLPTNKVVDDEQLKLYEMGKFDFQTSTMLLAPMVCLLILNLISLIGGLSRVIITGSFSEMFIQVFLSFFVVVMSYPVIEGMLLRKDKGRIPPSITIFSCIISLVLLSLGSFVLMYL